MKEYSYTTSLQDGGTASRILHLVGENKQVLELGCSIGVQSRILVNELGCEVTGVELNSEAAKQASTYCKQVIVGNLDQLDLRSATCQQQFDVVLCADVLEHLSNPLRVLKSVQTLLTKNGYVVLSVPNIAHSGLIFELAHGIFEYRDRGLLDDTHIHFFTRRSLVELLTNAGFVIDQLERAIAWPIDTEFNVQQSKREDRVFLDYLTINNPEALTYQFLVRATPSSESQARIQEQNREFESKNLSLFIESRKAIIENSRARITDHFDRFPAAYTELEWLRRGRLFRTAESLGRLIMKGIKVGRVK